MPLPAAGDRLSLQPAHRCLECACLFSSPLEAENKYHLLLLRRSALWRWKWERVRWDAEARGRTCTPSVSTRPQVLVCGAPADWEGQAADAQGEGCDFPRSQRQGAHPQLAISSFQGLRTLCKPPPQSQEQTPKVMLKSKPTFIGCSSSKLHKSLSQHVTFSPEQDQQSITQLLP